VNKNPYINVILVLIKNAILIGLLTKLLIVFWMG